ncbi:lytic transglycosylase domain-containing protein [Pelagibacterium limicola]|uniref:transglycosylase SLT domain-containing protein n=1 Tax=Pelagibacterium limicola TaxID=2791022 RepID=UPI0018B00D3A
MPARKLLALVVAFLIGCSVVPAKADERAYIELLIQYYAQHYEVPVELVRRVVNRESTFNPRARNGPYWGLMQILPATARTMGFTGKPEDLLDPETNLIYGVKYLRGAYLVAEGNHDRAVQHYARGYYYAARDKGLLELTGLRPGPSSPAAPPPPAQTAIVPTPPVPPERIPQFEPPVVAAVLPSPAVEPPAASAAAAEAPMVVALGFLPPSRPIGLIEEAASSPALAAIEAADATAPQPARPDPHDSLNASILMASAYMASNPDLGLRPSVDIFEGTFLMLEAIGGVQPGEVLR